MKPSLRFEVLKRDRFTCCYCGKHPPDVLLEIDHVVPRVDGGLDELSNLLAACTDCNRGKGARRLEEGVAPAVSQETIDDLRERIAQTKSYHALLAEMEDVVGDQAEAVWRRWGDVFDHEVVETGDRTKAHPPEEASLRYFFKHLTLAEVLDSVDATVLAVRSYSSGYRASRYFYGVCHGKIRQKRGEA